MTLQDAYATLKVDKKKRTVVLKELQKKLLKNPQWRRDSMIQS